MSDPIGSEPLRHPLGRRRFMAALTGGLLAAPLAAGAQQGVRVEGQRVPRIGVACNNCVSPPKPDDPLAAFLQELRRLGYEIVGMSSSTFVERRAIAFPRSLPSSFEPRWTFWSS